MTLDEYQNYISTELEILSKRLETFFEKDKDINRNQNIRKAYE